MVNTTQLKTLISKIEKDFGDTHRTFLKKDAVKLNFGLMAVSAIATDYLMDAIEMDRARTSDYIKIMMLNAACLTRDSSYNIRREDLYADVNAMADENEEFAKFLEFMSTDRDRAESEFEQFDVKLADFKSNNHKKTWTTYMSKYISKDGIEFYTDKGSRKTLETGFIVFGKLFDPIELNKYFEDAQILTSFKELIHSIAQQANEIMEEEQMGKYFEKLESVEGVDVPTETVRYFNMIVCRVILEALGEGVSDYNINKEGLFYDYLMNKKYLNVLKVGESAMKAKEKEEELKSKANEEAKEAYEAAVTVGKYKFDFSEFGWKDAAILVGSCLVGTYIGMIIGNYIKHDGFTLMDSIDYTNNSILDIFGLGYNKFV